LAQNSSQDDIQDIILQAQKAFAKQDTKRTDKTIRSDGVRTNGESQEEDNLSTENRRYPTNYSVMPNKPPLALNIHNTNDRSPTMKNVDLAQFLGSHHTSNTQHPDSANNKAQKSRNVMLSSN